MTRTPTASLLLTLLAGIVLALLLFPRWRDARDLDALMSSDETMRERVWERLTPADEAVPAPAQRLLEDINERLRDAPAEALIHAADALRPAGLWSWDHQPEPVILREARLRAGTDDPAQQTLAVEAMDSIPLHATADDVLPIIEELLQSDDPRIRVGAFEAAAAWAGPQQVEHLRTLLIPVSDERLHGLRRLAREAARRLAPPHEGDDLRSGRPDSDSLRLVVASEGVDPLNNRQAAWSMLDPSKALVEQVLAAPPADPDGSVCATVLLAERLLSRDAALKRAERWIRSFDDDEKRAGALLAALTDAHHDLLQRAYQIEDVASVRTTQRLALWALDRRVGREDPLEFAHRAMHQKDGGTNPDTLLAMLIAGRSEAIEALVTFPPESSRHLPALPQRIWLIERFLPGWLTAAGSVDAETGSDAGFQDRLRVIWMLTRRRLAFDKASREFRLELE